MDHDRQSTSTCWHGANFPARSMTSIGPQLGEVEGLATCVSSGSGQARRPPSGSASSTPRSAGCPAARTRHVASTGSSPTTSTVATRPFGAGSRATAIKIPANAGPVIPARRPRSLGSICSFAQLGSTSTRKWDVGRPWIFDAQRPHPQRGRSSRARSVEGTTGSPEPPNRSRSSSTSRGDEGPEVDRAGLRRVDGLAWHQQPMQRRRPVDQDDVVPQPGDVSARTASRSPMPSPFPATTPDDRRAHRRCTRASIDRSSGGEHGRRLRGQRSSPGTDRGLDRRPAALVAAYDQASSRSASR